MNTPKTDALASMIRVKALSRPETYNPPIWEHARQLETQVQELREALELSLRYGMTRNDLTDSHLLDKKAPIRIVSAILEKTS